MRKTWAGRRAYSSITPVFMNAPGEDDDDFGQGGAEDTMQGGGANNQLDENALFGFDDDDLLGGGTGDGGESEDDDTLTLDKDKILSEFWKDDGTGGTDEESDEDLLKRRQTQQTELATMMESDLAASFSVPEDMIPEDFNPTDPKQMRKFMADVGQHFARQTIRIMFKPVQASLGSISETMRREMRRTSNQAVDNQSTEQMLLTAIPNMNKPGLRPMVDTAFANAKKRFPNDRRKQVIATKQALIAVGIPIGNSSRVATGGSRGGGGSKGGAQIQGAGALDLYAPLPTKQPARSSQTQDRFRR